MIGALAGRVADAVQQRLLGIWCESIGNAGIVVCKPSIVAHTHLLSVPHEDMTNCREATNNILALEEIAASRMISTRERVESSIPLRLELTHN